MKKESQANPKDLLSTIDVLEAENAALSEKAEDSLLFGMVAEIIYQNDDAVLLLDQMLERISILKNIPFCACFDLVENDLKVLGFYSSFADFNTSSIRMTFPEVADKVPSDEGFLLIEKNEFESIGFDFEILETYFNIQTALIIKCPAKSIPDKFFVFLGDHQSGEQFPKILMLLQQVSQLATERLDKISIFKELTSLNKELDRRVADRTIELIAAKEKAEESDRLKTAFLQNMSHEIRTPLNAIMGFSDLLSEYLDDQEKLTKFSDIIKQRGYDLLDIINGILDIAKIESGHYSVYPEECNLSELIEDINVFCIDYQQRIERPNVKHRIKVAPQIKMMNVLIDHEKLKQVLKNLIGNAYKFTSAGLVEVGCNIFEDNVLTFYVSDTGIGIPKEKYSEIFSRFMQANPNTSRFYGGTGLGLSIVQGLLKLMKGEIWLESEIGKGSTFYFKVPFNLVGSEVPQFLRNEENR